KSINTFFGFHLSDNQPPPIAPNIAPKFNTNRNNILEWSGYPAAVIRPGSQVFIPKIINKHIENPIHNIIVLSARPFLNNSATEFPSFSTEDLILNVSSSLGIYFGLILFSNDLI